MAMILKDTLTLEHPILINALEWPGEAQPSQAFEYFSEGVVLWGKGQYQEALEAFEHALRNKPDFGEAWTNKGVTLWYLGKNQESLEAHEQALRYERDIPEAWYNKGMSLGEMGKYQGAMETFEQALRLRSDFPEAFYSKGVAFLELQKTEEALFAFEQALNCNEEYSLAWYSLGLTLGLLGKPLEAQQAFHRAYDLRDGLSDRVIGLYVAWSTLTLEQGLGAQLSPNIKDFEEAGLKYIDILEKAQQDDLGQVVEDALTEFKAGLKKKKEVRSFEELELFIDLMKIKDPFEGWRAIVKVVSERWPKGHSVVKAVREIRR